MNKHLYKRYLFPSCFTISRTVILLVLAFSQPVFGAAIETLESIHNSVTGFIKENFDTYTKIEIKIGLNDNRLRLNRCSQGLDVFWTHGARKVGNTSVGVRCSGNVKWTIYVPVKVKIYKPVMVAAATLTRGQILQTNDYQMEQRDISSLVNGFITTPDKYHNFLVKRPIRMGQILTPHMLQVPKMVLRGERVTLLAEAGSLQVRSAGVALEDGIRGETVRIRNSHSNRVIEGRVIAAGMVQITL